MAKEVKKPPTAMESYGSCGSCKEKLESWIEEWANNFKMCYCPWKSKTFDIDADSTTNEGVPLLTMKRDTRQVTPEKDKLEDDVFLPEETATTQHEVESNEMDTKDEETPAIKEGEETSLAQVEEIKNSQSTPTLDELQDLNIEPLVWSRLGFFLKVDGHRLNDIGRNSANSQDALYQMFDEWLEKDMLATWDELAQALDEMELKNTAAEVRQKYHQVKVQ